MAIDQVLFGVSLLKCILFRNVIRYIKEEKNFTFMEFYYIPQAFDICHLTWSNLIITTFNYSITIFCISELLKTYCPDQCGLVVRASDNALKALRLDSRSRAHTLYLSCGFSRLCVSL